MSTAKTTSRSQKATIAAGLAALLCGVGLLTPSAYAAPLTNSGTCGTSSECPLATDTSISDRRGDGLRDGTGPHFLMRSSHQAAKQSAHRGHSLPAFVDVSEDSNQRRAQCPLHDECDGSGHEALGEQTREHHGDGSGSKNGHGHHRS